MRIVRDEHATTLTLIPVEDEEEGVIRAIAEMLKPEDQLAYGGRREDSVDGKFGALRFHAGASKEQRVTINGGCKVSQNVYIGGVELVLRGSSPEDEQEARSIRDACYFGSGSLIFLGQIEVDGKLAIAVTVKRCKHCGVGMVQRSDCEWSTCRACTEICEHNYVEGAIHGGGVDIGVGEFCDKCGRAKPKAEEEREKSLLEKHLEVQRKLGIAVVYKTSSVQTPGQVVAFKRIMRGLDKSRRRRQATG